MTKKKRVQIRLAVADEDAHDIEDRRPAPNTNFLGRLVIGVATGNQRQMDATTSNAANMSIGATGAASLRLQLQRARSARFQTLRRVVLSSAERQRLTLCTALLAELAQGFGFRLTVRQPDGREVGAAQAMAAVAHLNEQQEEQQQPGGEDGTRDDAGGEAIDDEEGATDDGGDGDDDGGDATDGGAAADADQNDTGNSGGCATAAAAAAERAAALPRQQQHRRHEPLESLTPLDVKLELGLEPDGGGTGGLLAARGGTAQALPGEPLKTLVGGGLATRLARSPSGLRPSRPGAGGGSLSALLSGRLMSAALGSMGLTGCGKNTAAAAAVQAAKRRVLMRAASNAAAEENVAADVAAASSSPQVAAADAAAEARSAPGGDTGGAAATSTGGGGGAGRRIVWDPDNLPSLFGSTAPPPAKRARTSAAAASSAPARGDAAATAVAASASLDDGREVRKLAPQAATGGSECGPSVLGAVAGSGLGAADADADAAAADGDEMALGGERQVCSHVSGPDHPGHEAAALGGAGPAAAAGGSIDHKRGDHDGGGRHDGRGGGGGRVRDVAARDRGAARTSRWLGAALAVSVAEAAAGSRPRAPLLTSDVAASDGGGDTEEAGPAGRGQADASLAEGTAAGARTGATAATGGHRAARLPGGRGGGGSAAGSAGKASGLGTPASKLFGAAMRQLHRRSQG